MTAGATSPPRTARRSGGPPGRFESGSDLRLNDVIADGKPDDIGQGVQVELAHNRGTVRLHRLDAEVQTRGDGFVTVPLGQKLHDLTLTGSQPLGPKGTGWAGRPLRNPSKTTAETRPEKYGM